MKRKLLMCAYVLFLTTNIFAEIYAVKIGGDNFTYYSTPSSPESPGNVYYRHAIENEKNKEMPVDAIATSLPDDLLSIANAGGAHALLPTADIARQPVSAKGSIQRIAPGKKD